MSKKINKEFLDFLAENNVVDIAIGTSIGFASKSFIDSFFDSVANPIIQNTLNIPVLSKTNVNIGEVEIKLGKFLMEFIKYIVLLILIFLMVYYFLMPLFGYKKKEQTKEENKVIPILEDINNKMDLISSKSSL